MQPSASAICLLRASVFCISDIRSEEGAAAGRGVLDADWPDDASWPIDEEFVACTKGGFKFSLKCFGKF